MLKPMSVNRVATIVGAMLLCLSLPVYAVADTSGTKKGKAGKTPSAAAKGKKAAPREQILQASSAYFAGFPFVLAEDVYEDIVKGGDQSYLLVSVQSPDEFAKGHVPGALNIPLRDIASRKSLQLLPSGKKIVLTCDDGHRSMMAALFLGQLGYDTAAMSMGLSHWNSTESGISSPYRGSAGYPVSADKVVAATSGKVPTASNKGKLGNEVVIERTDAVVKSGRSLFIDRSEVYEKAVVAGDKNYVLVSMQRPEHFAKGHVPGAINIPYYELAKAETLRKLPRDKKIVLICYIGHWGGSGALLLNQLGYDAYDMRFGTLGWNDTTEGLGQMKEAMTNMGRSLNYPIERGDVKK